MLKRIFFFYLLSVLCIPLSVSAQVSIDSVQQKLDALLSSSDITYAKSTTKRAEAYMGAAMLAADEENEEQLQNALQKANDAIEEAHTNAELFRQHYHDLILRQKASQEALAYLPKEAKNKLREPNPYRLMEDADKYMAKVIKMAETGKLNASQQAAGSARVAYKKVLDAALPDLIDNAENIISDAAAKGGKSYTPITYEQAKKELAALQAYVKGTTTKIPEHPALAIVLAKQALDISIQVKAWRKKKGSHEMLVLQARDQRMDIAHALHIKTQALDIDVSLAHILATIQKYDEDKKAYQNKLQLLEVKYQQDLQKKLDEQREQLLLEGNTRLGDLKEAYRAKIERETFELKRQKQLRSLFKDDETNILVNLDGSLIIRLGSLKFPPASKKIDSKYFDLLGRVKEALTLYGERNIRIEGHTDNQGDLKANQKLSLQRAEAVREFLIATGEDPSRLRALGYGEVRPIASNDFAQGREMNRRIDLVIEAAGE